MPQFIIEHTRDFDHGFWAELRSQLAEVGVAAFSTREWPLTSRSFSFKVERISLPSVASDDIVIRLHLHPFEERMRKSAENARNIFTAVISLLNTYDYFSIGDIGPTVGVSLTYGTVEWAGGNRGDVNGRDLKRLADLSRRPRPNPRYILEE